MAGIHCQGHRREHLSVQHHHQVLERNVRGLPIAQKLQKSQKMAKQ